MRIWFQDFFLEVSENCNMGTFRRFVLSEHISSLQCINFLLLGNSADLGSFPAHVSENF